MKQSTALQKLEQEWAREIFSEELQSFCWSVKHFVSSLIWIPAKTAIEKLSLFWFSGTLPIDFIIVWLGMLKQTSSNSFSPSDFEKKVIELSKMFPLLLWSCIGRTMKNILWTLRVHIRKKKKKGSITHEFEILNYEQQQHVFCLDSEYKTDYKLWHQSRAMKFHYITIYIDSVQETLTK